jgi:hypothetical protein
MMVYAPMTLNNVEADKLSNIEPQQSPTNDATTIDPSMDFNTLGSALDPATDFMSDFIHLDPSSDYVFVRANA